MCFKKCLLFFFTCGENWAVTRRRLWKYFFLFMIISWSHIFIKAVRFETSHNRSGKSIFCVFLCVIVSVNPFYLFWWGVFASEGKDCASSWRQKCRQDHLFFLFTRLPCFCASCICHVNIVGMWSDGSKAFHGDALDCAKEKWQK